MIETLVFWFMDFVFLCILLFIFLLIENETVVEEIIQNHRDDVDENKDAGAFDKIEIKGKMKNFGDLEGKFVKRSEKSEKPS